MRSLREWAESIRKARTIADAREIPAVKAAEALVIVGKTEAIRPVVKRIHKAGVGIHNAGSVWYSIGAKTFRDLTLTAADDEDVTVEKSCDICFYPYAIKIKAWKIRSCNCAAAPCPKCSAFQIIDLDRLRKERYGAC